MATPSSNDAYQKNKIDPIYVKESYMYKSKVGSQEFRWHVIQSQQIGKPSLNNASRNITFQDVLNNSYFRLSESHVILSLRITAADGTSAVSETSRVGITPDSFITYGQFKLGTQEIHNQGNKDRLYKSAHIEKLLSYEPSFAKEVSGHQYFYPDTGTVGGASRVPFSHKGAVGRIITPNTLTMSGAITNADGTYSSGTAGNNATILQNFLIVGNGDAGIAGVATAVANVNGAAPAVTTLVDISRSDTANGNPAFVTEFNEIFNKGFYDREKRVNGSKIITISIPLKHYFRTLTAFNDVVTATNLECLIRLPSDAEMLMAIGAVGNGLRVMVQKAELRIPAYTPNYFVRSVLQKRLNVGEVSIRKFIDWDYQVSIDLPVAATGTTVTYPGNIDRRPLFFLFGFQYIGDFDSTTGNCHRYFNPQLTSAQISIGGGSPIASTYLVGDATNNDQQAYFEELMKVADIINPCDGKALDWDSFQSHKYLVPFDMRDQLSDETINDIVSKSVPVRFQTTHAAIPTTVADAANMCGFPGGGYRVVMFAGLERAIEVKVSSTGLVVKPGILA